MLEMVLIEQLSEKLNYCKSLNMKISLDYLVAIIDYYLFLESKVTCIIICRCFEIAILLIDMWFCMEQKLLQERSEYPNF